MNIALVCDYSLDYLGGAQTAFLQQVKAMTDAGHSVVVIAPRGRRCDLVAAAHEWIDARVTIPGIQLPFIRNTDALVDHLARVFARYRIEVVHVHSEFGLAAASIDAARLQRIAVVHTVHTFFWRAGLPPVLDLIAARAIRVLHARVTRQPSPTAVLAAARADSALRGMTLSTARRADVVVSPSEHQRDRLVAAGLGSVVAIPNTVASPEVARPLPLGHIEGPLRVLWVGRCAPEKRLPVFIEACRLALDSVPSGSLAIEVVGAGPDLPHARRMARGHSEFTFLGRCSTDEVAERLAHAHLAALTSSGFDNQPMTVVEALYASRPVLFVDPVLREGLDTAGLLCSDDSAEAIARMLVDLARDPHRVVRASERAEVAFDRFAPERFVAEIEGVYARLVPGGRHAAVFHNSYSTSGQA